MQKKINYYGQMEEREKDGHHGLVSNVRPAIYLSLLMLETRFRIAGTPLAGLGDERSS